MPEKVHTRFDDDRTFSASQSKGIASRSSTQNAPPLEKKRKRAESEQEITTHRTVEPSSSKDSSRGSRIEPLDRSRSQNGNSRSAPKDFTAGTRSSLSLREKSRNLYEVRKKLPIFPHADEIRQLLRSNNALLLVGETGSGKSTQVPQFLLDEPWCKLKNVVLDFAKNGPLKNISVGGCIAITEPRRVAAISLARRVADEMGTPLGSSSPASKVGYSVRFDTSTSPSTRVKFLTEGMLLQEMLRDPWLKQYSAVVVDEVHERGINVDLVLGFMRRIVCGNFKGRGGVPLKVVVMSATANMEGIRNFFEEGFEDISLVHEDVGSNVEIQCFEESQTGHAENSELESEWSGISSGDETKPKIAVQGRTTINGASRPNTVESSHDHVSICHIEGRQYAVKVIYSPEPVQDFVDAALGMIFQIHYKEPMPGDILVFLTGQETVESLEALVNEYALSMDKSLPKVLVLPLFAALPQAAQQRVFLPAPPKTRKIILATNIAETSVTVSGVRFVVDCGKAKMKQFRTRLGLDSLLVKPISRSAAEQRKGRAGREAPGQCYRLYTESDYLSLQHSNTPEILRCDLSQSILTMKARGVDNIMEFPFLDRPPREALEKALLQLYHLRALSDSGEISEIGLQIARLPLSAPLGRVLLAAADPASDCLVEIIDIISCLSVENVFLNITSEEKKEEAEAARKELFRREGDHLTLMATVQAFADERADRKAWAERHFVSHRAMQAVMDVRKQLTHQAQQLKLLPKHAQPTNPSDPSLAPSIIKCFLKGFASNTARLFPDGSYKTVVGHQVVAIHPSSVLFGRKVEAIMYNEFVFTNRSYARGVSAVQLDWVGEALAG